MEIRNTLQCLEKAQISRSPVDSSVVLSVSPEAMFGGWLPD